MNQKKTAKAVLAAFTLSAALPFSALAATDIQGHWAENVLTEWENGKLLSGYEDGSVRPDQKITRAEFVSLVNRAARYKYEGNKVTFTDVKDGDWYYQQVAIAANKGFVGGFEDNTFRPGEGLTRAEAASILARMEKLEPNADKVKEFKDADKVPAWAAGAIGAVAEKGFMVGDPDGAFHADRVLSRAEAVAALDRAGIDIVEPVEPEVPEIPPFIPGGGGGGGTVDPTPNPETPVTVTTPQKNMYIDPEFEYALKDIQIETTISHSNVGSGATDTNTAETVMNLPEGVSVYQATVPKNTSFKVTLGNNESLNVNLAENLKVPIEVIYNPDVTQTLTVKDFKQYVSPTSIAYNKLVKLEQAGKGNEALVECTPHFEYKSDGSTVVTFKWNVKGMSIKEQQNVFAQLEVAFSMGQG